MDILHDIPGLRAAVPQGTPHAVTIGNFDGVHLGHYSLIARTREKAARLGISSLAVTFEPHPLRLLSGVHLPDLLTDLPRKLELLAAAGIDRTLVLMFTRELAVQTPETFVSDLLVEHLRVRELVIGYDYAFGQDRRGDYALLSRLGEQLGFGVEQMPPLRVGDAVASSSLIRQALKEGQVERAAALLGRPHSVDGTVVRGMGRGGAALGFPTANLSLGDVLLPQNGVYAAWAEFGPPGAPTSPLMAVVNVGTNPTFGGSCLSLEAHVLDFSQDVYGNAARLYFMRRLRDESRFSSLNALREQITRDTVMAREWLSRPEGRLKPPFSV